MARRDDSELVRAARLLAPLPVVDTTPPATPEAARGYIRRLKAMQESPKMSPKDHWRRNLQRFKPHEIGHYYAVEALKKLDPQSERVPGEDDE